MAISQEIHQPLIPKISLKIITKIGQKITGSNELKWMLKHAPVLDKSSVEPTIQRMAVPSTTLGPGWASLYCQVISNHGIEYHNAA